MNSGKRLSFVDLLVNENLRIEIPMIQRDYAQGRVSEKEKRENFVKSLKSCLVDQKPSKLDLDFVYGTIDRNVFIPLDGQQRLTTLFLLHLFLSLKEGRKVDFEKLMCTDSGETRFSYQTRNSAEIFCEKIIKDFDISKEEIKNQKISKIIKDQHWFFLSWLDDPTVISFLEMLDTLQEAFTTTTELFDGLVSPAKLISFQFLNLQEFDLTDDLYIKMNARGKPLSRFENFKAWLQNSIVENDIEIQEKQWKKKLDGEWLDIFWNKENPEQKIDEKFLNFFRIFMGYSYAQQVSKTELKEDKNSPILEIFLSDKPVNLTLLENEKYSIFNKETLDFCFKTLNNLQYLFSSEFEDLTSSIICFPFQEKSLLDYVTSNKSSNLDLAPRCFLFSLMKIVSFFDKPISDYSEDEKSKLKDWLRITRNLVYNQNIQGHLDFVNAITSINSLSENDFIIDSDLLSQSFEKGQFFRKDQVEEEIKKIEFKRRDKRWNEFFNKYENHYYFYGRVCFLLKLPKEENIDFKRIEQYSSKLAKIFNKYRGTNDSSFQRALFTKGFCLIPKKKNFSFYSWDANNVRQRNENWRELFKKDEKLTYLKELLDDTRTFYEIINDYEGKGWISLIIKHPEVIDYCSSNLIRKKDKQGKNIRLLKTTQIYGSQGELRSLIFYYKFLEKLSSEFKPFTKSGYYTSVGQYEYPAAYLNEFKLDNNEIGLDIRYKDSKYELRLLDYNNSSFNPEIQKILNKFNFIETSNYDDNSVVKYLDTEESALNELRSLCCEFLSVEELIVYE